MSDWQPRDHDAVLHAAHHHTLHPRRHVSPIRASRFAFIYSLSRNTSSPAPTLPSPTAARKPASPSPMSLHKPTQSRTTTVDSIFSNATVETARTSVGSDDHIPAHQKLSIESPQSPVCIVSPEEWFARFHSEEDLAADGDECPDGATLAAVQDIELLDAEGQSRTFGSLYDPQTATHQRQLVIFVRHFYCGACQAYLKALTEGISMQEYFTVPIPTSIIVIGCGQPDLIRHYKKFTGCPFPMFADPSRKLFKKLGMTRTLKTGRERPDYMKDISKAAWLGGQFKTISLSLRDPEGIRKRDVVRGGNPMQIGGEFLFDDGRVTWCHRMRHYRDHAETSVLRKLLELDE